MSAAPAILPRLHAAGADAVLRDGWLILSGVSRLPTQLVEEARARRADLLAEIAAQANNHVTLVAPDDAIERAAIQAEGVPVQRLRKRMGSWLQRNDEPLWGDYCERCTTQIWWTSVPVSDGWRCSWCHPEDDLPPGTFREQPT